MNLKNITYATLGLITTLVVISAHAKPHFKVGDKAPDFQLIDDAGQTCKLSAMRGKKVALFFYPWDQSPHCTEQACSIRDGYTDLLAAGIVVWGINPGSVRDHQEFKKAHNLQFPLLADPDKVVAKLYGAKRWAFPNRRITVLIDEDGYIVAILKDINLSAHADQIIQAFKKAV